MAVHEQGECVYFVNSCAASSIYTGPISIGPSDFTSYYSSTRRLQVIHIELTAFVLIDISKAITWPSFGPAQQRRHEGNL